MLLEVAVTCKHQVEPVVRDNICLNKRLCLLCTYEFGSSGLTVLLCYFFQCLGNEIVDPSGTAEEILSIGDISLELIPVGYPVKDVLLIDVAELDLSDIFSLLLIDSEALHEVRDNVGFKLCLSDDLNCLIDVKEYDCETV